MAKKPSAAGRTSDAARRIWLAGVGAYGRAFTEAQGSLAKVTEDTSRLFEELVAKGEAIEGAVEARGRELVKQAALPAASLDDRMRRMRERLKLGDAPDETRVGALEARLAAIEAKLDRALAGKPASAKKAPVKPVKKAAAKAKPARKKSPR